MLSKLKIKYIQSLGHKKFRDEEGVFLAEGPKIVEELLQLPGNPVQAVYGLADWTGAWQSATGTGPEIVTITPAELEKISQLTTSNKVVALVNKFEAPADLPAKGALVLALDAIQDPGNLGTIIRIADWFGINRIVCSPECADVYNPKVVQATMGSIARVRILYTGLEEWLARQAGIAVYAAALEGQPVTAMKLLEEGIVIIGNESRGIRASVMDKVGTRLTIPRIGRAESLNAAVATGIILSHLRQ